MIVADETTLKIEPSPAKRLAWKKEPSWRLRGTCGRDGVLGTSRRAARDCVRSCLVLLRVKGQGLILTSTSALNIRSTLSRTNKVGACQHASSNHSFILPFNVGCLSSENLEQSMYIESVCGRFQFQPGRIKHCHRLTCSRPRIVLQLLGNMLRQSSLTRSRVADNHQARF